MTVQERVAAGMAWLDERYPDHVERFNPDVFDIACRWHPGDPGDLGDLNRSCVLMQATGQPYWSYALMAAGLDDTDGDQTLSDLGFIHDGDYDDYVALNPAWLDAYAVRKAEMG